MEPIKRPITKPRPNREKRLEWQKIYDESHKKEHYERCLKYAKANPEKRKESKRRYIERNKEELSLRMKLRRLQDSEYRERERKKCREYYQKHKGEDKARVAKRRAALLQRTPKWADLEAIKEFYKNCPPNFQVDHIIPLQGKYVSGFHVLENLQYLPGSANQSKRNKFKPFNFTGEYFTLRQ